MPNLCLNTNYKQVLGGVSRQVSTGSTPGHWAHVSSYRVAKYYERYFAHWLNEMVSLKSLGLHFEKLPVDAGKKKKYIMQVNPLIF